jgi:hypothetical protein
MTVYQLAFALFLGLTAERWVNGAITFLVQQHYLKQYEKKQKKYLDEMLFKLDQVVPPDVSDDKLTVN